MPSFNGLKIKIFADGADTATIAKLAVDSRIAGFTTNPSLMRKAGVVDYEVFAHNILKVIGDRPISFEVLADDGREIERQARKIASWGPNVFAKVPITNSRRESMIPTIRRLVERGVALNVTALFSLVQVEAVAQALRDGPRSFVSLFAGRIADTGRDPVPLVARAVELLHLAPNAELIWASPRELLNVFQADSAGCHIITVTPGLLDKMILIGKDLLDYSAETVEMFFLDGQASGFIL